MKILHAGFGFHPWRYGGLIAYAEDLMQAQVARGHEVAYFFHGRHYRWGRDDRLRRWERDGVAMLEILNSTLNFGGDAGTKTPEADSNHPPTEALFAEVLDELRPDVVHVQEFIGIPTSIIDVARSRAVPIVMTLQDYYPLCPTLKLYDVDHQRCLRPDVGAQCVRCSAGAPDNRTHLVLPTDMFELQKRISPRWMKRAQAATALARRIAAQRALGAEGTAPPPPPDMPSAARYQARRDIAVERLSGLDAAIAMSERVGEIYRMLGVDAETVRVVHLTVRHLESLRPKAIETPPAPVRFATLNGVASEQKGAEVVLGALEELVRRGYGGRFELAAFGYVGPSYERRLRAIPGASNGGIYDSERLEPLLEPFHVGIVPSEWEEAYGYVGVELLCSGVPVIGNARGGIVDYVRDGETGWVNHGADAAGLAAIMASIIDSPQQVVERNAWLRAHRETIAKPFDVHAAEMEGIYASLRSTSSVR